MHFNSIAQLMADAMLVLIPMVLSLTVHEFAHAFAASRLGDDTAQRAGRLTLNPLAHADPLGTVVLPLLILMANGAMGAGRIPFFGWARPVPVNPAQLTRRLSVRMGSVMVAAAGPLANLALGVLCAGLLSVVRHGGYEAHLPASFQTLLVQMLFINVALFIFNMLPIYPLDGEKVVSGLLSPQKAQNFAQFNQRFGTLMLWGIVFFARDVMAYPFRLLTTGVLSMVGLG